MVGALAGAAIRTVEELDRFKEMAEKVDMSLISMAKAATDSQIKTETLMSGLARMSEAGLKPSQSYSRLLELEQQTSLINPAEMQTKFSSSSRFYSARRTRLKALS